MCLLLGSALAVISRSIGADLNTNTGLVEVRITDHKAGIDQFSSLKVTMAEISLHKKGFGRREGWVLFSPIEPEPTQIDIVPLKDGRYQSFGEGQMLIGSYDALRISFAETVGELKKKSESFVRGADTVVAVSLLVNDKSNLPIVIDLYVEDQTEHDPPVYVVKVKEIRTAV